MSTSHQEKQIIDWFRAKGPIDFHDHFDLIENRVIDSLRFMEFLYFLQEVTGRDIKLDGLTLDHFRTLHAIRTNFLLDAQGAAAEPMEEIIL